MPNSQIMVPLSPAIEIKLFRYQTRMPRGCLGPGNSLPLTLTSKRFRTHEPCSPTLAPHHSGTLWLLNTMVTTPGTIRISSNVPKRAAQCSRRLFITTLALSRNKCRRLGQKSSIYLQQTSLVTDQNQPCRRTQNVV